MDDRVEATILVRPEVAALLQDPKNQLSLGELLANTLWPQRFSSPLMDAIASTKVAARATGLTDEDIEQELRDHKAERSAIRAAE